MKQNGFIDFIAVLAIALIVGMAGYFFSVNRETEQSFETVAKGYYSGEDEKKEYVIHDTDDWRNLWDRTYKTITPKPALPSVDFKNEMVIAVFLGGRATGGYAIEITKISPKDNVLEVIVRETSPPPGAIVTQALTQPFHIVKNKRIDKEVVFKY